MSFQDYLQNRQSAFQQMTETLKQDSKKESFSDDRLWKPVMGKDGTGYAVVRFLPGTDPSKTPWVRVYDHGFQGPTGKWYIENSLTTLGQQDPVSEYNTKLWNSGIEANKDQARKQKRRTSYYANVLVIKDPANPQNEGEVKIYRFGQKIFDKVMAAMQPEFADEQPVNPFDIIDGANFRIKLKTVAGYWNYDSSDFEAPSALSDDESRLEAVFNAQHDVQELIAPAKFKSYDDLKTKLNAVLGESEAVAAPAPVATPTPAVQEKVELPTAETSSTSTEDDDLEAYFKALADD